jgi:prepilin-type N-terminal cleavage/methylation domain-containing protein
MKTKEKGFTIIELLVAVLLAAVVTSAAMALYITQHKQLVIQDEVADMQSSLRASISEVSTKVRMAGYNVPDAILPVEASNTNPDTITITYDSGILRGVQVEHDMPAPSVELRCDGHDLTGLNEGDWVYIYDPNTRTGEYFQVTAVQNSDHIQHNTMPLSKAYPAGSKILKMSRYKYFIDSSDTSHPRLMVQLGVNSPQAFADNITDLNIQYLMSSGAVVDVPSVVDMIREAIIRIDARTDMADDEFLTQYRTRSLTTRAKVRNLGVN